jgi:LuxR family transcriptional regulator, regulator of acetate metabolism
VSSVAAGSGPSALEELLSRAADNLRGRARVPLVFGGFGSTTVPVTMAMGRTTSALTSMVIRPARGLGGRTMVQGRLLAVTEYERAHDITHDYDGRVPSKGVVGLAVAPLMCGTRVAGLLYAATRSPAGLTRDVVAWLASQAQAISLEVSVRDALERQVSVEAERTARLSDLARAIKIRIRGRRSSGCSPPRRRVPATFSRPGNGTCSSWPGRGCATPRSASGSA